MAIGVVHLFEAIDVDEEDCQRVPVTRDVLQRHVQPIEEKHSIGHGGQGIEVGLMVEPLLATLPFTREVHKRMVIEPETSGKSDDEADEDQVHEPAAQVVPEISLQQRFLSHEELDRGIAEQRDHDRGGRSEVPRHDERGDKDRRTAKLRAEQRV
jgi:hypothetical protein